VKAHVRVRAARLEDAAVLVLGFLVAVYIGRHVLRADVFEGDAFVHQYWMWHWRDPGLFNDPLTAELRDSSRYPLGYQALFWVGTQVVSPIVFGEWVGVALMALSGWLVFRIARENAAWPPAAWLAAALFLAPYDIHRFSGGFARAFVQPVVLATVLLALRRRPLGAAIVAGGGALLYPPAAVLGVGVVLAGALRWRDGRPAVDGRAAAHAGLALGIALVVLLGPQLVSGAAPAVLSAAQARQFPEFRAGGTLHFFAPTVTEYLRQNRSGFDLRVSGSILALAALALLLARPSTVRLLRGPVRAMPVVSLAAWSVAQLVLFRLYLPHRYTYPLIAFFAIALGVGLLPLWTAVWERRRGRAIVAAAILVAPLLIAAIAVYGFPLGPVDPLSRLWTGAHALVAVAGVALAAAAAVVLARVPGGRGTASAALTAARRPAVGALLSGVTLLGVLVVVPTHPRGGWTCPTGPAVRHIAALPKDAIIAGDPSDLACLPATARRAVVTSTQLAPSYESAYFRDGRARMFALLRAVYGPSADAITQLRTDYGATDLWIKPDGIRAEAAGHGLWRARAKPYAPFVARTIREGPPASLALPVACRRYDDATNEIYDIACLERARARAS
jgi:hypothetical protein